MPKNLPAWLFLSACLYAHSYGIAQNAPQLSNMGALVSVKGGFVSVKGDVHNDRNGHFDNSDTLFVSGDWRNYVAQPFTSTSNQQGFVKLVGGTERIGGSLPSNFYNLELFNRAVKTADVDVHIFGSLDLRDCELSAQNNHIIVYNSDPNAVSTGQSGVWGFVSNGNNGGLRRFSNQTSAYFYPMGAASSPNAVFRPVLLTPDNASASSHEVGFFLNDATNLGYDRTRKDFSLCEINPRYFHKIQQTGAASPANVGAITQLLVDTVADGSWQNLAVWDATASWRESQPLSAGFNPTYNLHSYTSAAAVYYPTQNYQPVALARVAPAIELQLPAGALCANDSILATAVGDFASFDFYQDSFLRQSSPADSYGFMPVAGQTLLWVVGANQGCGRASAVDTLQILNAANAQASRDTIIIRGTNANLSASGGLFYDWQPPLGLSCTGCPNPVASPDSNTVYTVRVENLDGCVDYDTVVVTVKSDVENVLFIPNVLTPNGDGKNDTWFIKNIELFPTNKVRILNRWGDVVFIDDNYLNDFDGTFAGGKLPAGTYYYIIDLGAGWGVFKGDVTIIR